MQTKNMEGNFDRLLTSWMSSYSKVDKLNFKMYGLDSLFSLKGLQLDEPFLRVVVWLWDFEFHIFKFGLNLEEQCHIVEEFEALLSSFKRSEVIYLTILNKYVNSIASCLGFIGMHFFLCVKVL